MSSKCVALSARAVLRWIATNTMPSAIDKPTVASRTPNTTSTATLSVSRAPPSWRACPARRSARRLAPAQTRSRRRRVRVGLLAMRAVRTPAPTRRRASRTRGRGSARPPGSPLPTSATTGVSVKRSNAERRRSARTSRVSHAATETIADRTNRRHAARTSAAHAAGTAISPHASLARRGRQHAQRSARAPRDRASVPTYSPRPSSATGTAPARAKNRRADGDLAEQQRREQQAEAGEVADVGVADRNPRLAAAQQKDPAQAAQRQADDGEAHKASRARPERPPAVAAMTRTRPNNTSVASRPTMSTAHAEASEDDPRHRARRVVPRGHGVSACATAIAFRRDGIPAARRPAPGFRAFHGSRRSACPATRDKSAPAASASRPSVTQLHAGEDQQDAEQQQRPVADRLLAEQPHVGQPAGDGHAGQSASAMPIRPKICSGRVE